MSSARIRSIAEVEEYATLHGQQLHFNIFLAAVFKPVLGVEVLDQKVDIGIKGGLEVTGRQPQADPVVDPEAGLKVYSKTQSGFLGGIGFHQESLLEVRQLGGDAERQLLENTDLRV